MRNIGIKYQLLITTLVPVIVVAALFALFYNGQFYKDLKQHNLRLGEAYVKQLLPAAQLAVLRDDKRTMQGLIDASTINQEIKSLAFYNADGQLLAFRGGRHSLKKPFRPPSFTGDYILSKPLSATTINFVAPITVPKFNLYSFAPFRTPINPSDFRADDVLGWLSLEIDTTSTLVTRYQMYLVTIFITLFGLLIGLVIHSYFSRKIYWPIARLRRSMTQILRNEFETQIKVVSPGELGTIEQGCAHLQKEYLHILDDLNQHVEIATTDLQKNLEVLEEKNIELVIDKKKLEEKSRQKSEFLANMSHEIRTPMNGIMGFTNLLMESKLDPLQQDYVKTIRNSSQDLLTIINDILDYSKMDAGKLQLDCIPLDIRTCIDEVFALMAPHAHKKGVDLIPSTDNAVPKTVLGDPLRLKQIITNLVSNAIKFTDHGYVLLRTTIEQESDKDYTVCLSVIDTGIGIAPEDQTSLFNAFNQADTSITRRFGGSGLGLVICKKLAEHMQGRMAFTSELHKGSTFSVHIKLEKLLAYEIEKNQVHRFSNLKVICFDDNPLHLEALCNGLGNWGIQCVRVSAFSKLSKAFRDNPDCHLAFINVNQGCEQQVQQVLHKQSIPCALVSKWPIQEYESLGAQACLFKPPNIQKLHETIESLLNADLLTTSEPEEISELRKQLRVEQATILVAEDNPVNLLLLNSLLAENATVISAQDGEEAVSICQQTRFDVILLDLQMPKLDGLDAAALIRQQSMLNKTTPIILISANSVSPSSDTYLKTGIDLCLPKPIDEAILLRHLLRLIEQVNTRAINWSMCVKKASNNEPLAEEFLAKFVEELEKDRATFIRLFEAGDVVGIERAAHRLHGACCFCGVPELQGHVANLEILAKNAKTKDELHWAYEPLLTSIDRVIEEYTRYYYVAEKVGA